MTVSAHDIARELRARHPGLPTVKLHKLLYYCQGHHLATFGKPLFIEAISAWDMGPVVSAVWKQDNTDKVPETRSELTEAHLNTIGYVLSRYGAPTGRDLVHDQEVMPEPAEIRELLRGAEERRTKPARRDSLEELLARRG